MVLADAPIVLRPNESAAISDPRFGCPCPDHQLCSRLVDAYLACISWEERDLQDKKDPCST